MTFIELYEGVVGSPRSQSLISVLPYLRAFFKHSSTLATPCILTPFPTLGIFLPSILPRPRRRAHQRNRTCPNLVRHARGAVDDSGLQIRQWQWGESRLAPPTTSCRSLPGRPIQRAWFPLSACSPATPFSNLTTPFFSSSCCRGQGRDEMSMDRLSSISSLTMDIIASWIAQLPCSSTSSGCSRNKNFITVLPLARGRNTYCLRGRRLPTISNNFQVRIQKVVHIALQRQSSDSE
ncbi:hypothetical protein DFH06DRAFT_454764 [Mycena polygramma]|nr:hypothetical protein DFH06DRAFT_454764 [Mycena polygramma]